jgi:hypothetical protein
MEDLTGQIAVRVAVDRYKNLIKIHAENGCGKVLRAKALSRQKFLGWCVSNLPAGTEVALEACSGAQHWARQLQAKGFEPMLLLAHLVEPFRRQGKRGKNDANDAAAIWDAAGRPRIHSVPVKTPEQQGILAVHRLREAYKAASSAPSAACSPRRGLSFLRAQKHFAWVWPMRWKVWTTVDCVRSDAHSCASEVQTLQLGGAQRANAPRGFARCQRLQRWVIFFQQRQQAHPGCNRLQVPQDLGLRAAEVTLFQQYRRRTRDSGPQRSVCLPTTPRGAQACQLLAELAGFSQALGAHEGFFVALHGCNTSLKRLKDRVCGHYCGLGPSSRLQWQSPNFLAAVIADSLTQW